MTTRHVRHVESGRLLLKEARWCNSFATKLRGFTWRHQLQAGEGLVLVESGDSRVSTAIHMLFVFCDLGVVWVNDAGQVVDKCIAKPWRLSYVPQAAARYVIEMEPALLDQVAIGEHIAFEPSTSNES